MMNDGGKSRSSQQRRTGSIRFLFRQPPSAGRRPAIFLDRDGVINERILNGYVASWQEFRFIDGVQRALRALARLRFPILVISNQSGVGKGLVGRRALQEITRRFVGALERRGGRIGGVYYCPHRPGDGCPCRKPQPGLLLEAARDWRINLAASVMVGDTATDIEAARAAGCRGILFDTAVADVELGRARSREHRVLVRGIAELPTVVAQMLGRL